MPCPPAGTPDSSRPSTLGSSSPAGTPDSRPSAGTPDSRQPTLGSSSGLVGSGSSDGSSEGEARPRGCSAKTALATLVMAASAGVMVVGAAPNPKTREQIAVLAIEALFGVVIGGVAGLALPSSIREFRASSRKEQCVVAAAFMAGVAAGTALAVMKAENFALAAAAAFSLAIGSFDTAMIAASYVRNYSRPRGGPAGAAI